MLSTKHWPLTPNWMLEQCLWPETNTRLQSTWNVLRAEKSVMLKTKAGWIQGKVVEPPSTKSLECSFPWVTWSLSIGLFKRFEFSPPDVWIIWVCNHGPWSMDPKGGTTLGHEIEAGQDSSFPTFGRHCRSWARHWSQSAPELWQTKLSGASMLPPWAWNPSEGKWLAFRNCCGMASLKLTDTGGQHGLARTLSEK